MVNGRRVVVTGLGVISSIGIGKEAFWKSLLEGQSGISQITRFDTSDFDVHIGGEVKSFRPEDFFDKNTAGKLGRAAQFAIAAVHLALKDAGLQVEELVGSNTAVCLGTTMADIQSLESIDDKMVQQESSLGYFSRRKTLQYPG